jgi:hypothetical protein
VHLLLRCLPPCRRKVSCSRPRARARERGDATTRVSYNRRWDGRREIERERVVLGRRRERDGSN